MHREELRLLRERQLLWAQQRELDLDERDCTSKLEENLYELTAVRTDEPAELDAFLSALKRKYDFEPKPEQRGSAALFRLEPRPATRH